MEEFEKDYFFFTYIIEFTIKALRPGLSFVEKFLITDLISLMVVDLLRFSVRDSVSIGCMFLGLYPEKAVAPHSSTPTWKIPWTGEPGRLQSMRSLRVGHD